MALRTKRQKVDINDIIICILSGKYQSYGIKKKKSVVKTSGEKFGK